MDFISFGLVFFAMRSTASAVTVRSTIRCLREQTESSKVKFMGQPHQYYVVTASNERLLELEILLAFYPFILLGCRCVLTSGDILTQ